MRAGQLVDAPVPAALRGLPGSLGGDGAKPALARVELGDGLLEIGGGEIRPAAIGEIELGVRALPKEEITQPLLAAGANQQIDIAARASPVIDPAQRIREVFAADVLRGREGAR